MNILCRLATIPILISLFVPVIACDNTGELSTARYYPVDRTTGIIATDPEGVLLGEWRVPTGDPKIINGMPNPSMGALTVVFKTACRGPAKIWIEPLLGPDDLNTGSIFVESAGGRLVRPTKLQIRTLIDNIVEADFHTVEWDTKDDTGLDVPSGFYRIHTETECDGSPNQPARNHFWIDIFIYRNCKDVPADMYMYVMCDS